MSTKLEKEGIETLPFERAIARVEELVAAMESDRLPLDDLIRFYEEGTQLIKVCRQRIDEAQRKVELITRKADGSLGLQPIESDETPDAESGAVRSRPRRRANTSTDDDETIPF
jgi:exodeoxyribonuclease VII small subunit